MLQVEWPFAFTSRRPNVVRSLGYYVSSFRACGVLAVPFISPCSRVARWRPHGRIAVIHWVVPVHSESWVNCEESIYSRPIACRLARSLALYPPRTSRLAPRILPVPSCWNSKLYIRLASDTKFKLFSLNYKHYVRIRGSVIISVREQKFSGTKVSCIVRLTWHAVMILDRLRFNHVERTSTSTTYSDCVSVSGRTSTDCPPDFSERLHAAAAKWLRWRRLRRPWRSLRSADSSRRQPSSRCTNQNVCEFPAGAGRDTPRACVRRRPVPFSLLHWMPCRVSSNSRTIVRCYVVAATGWHRRGTNEWMNERREAGHSPRPQLLASRCAGRRSAGPGDGRRRRRVRQPEPPLLR